MNKCGVECRQKREGETKKDREAERTRRDACVYNVCERAGGIRQ